MPADLGPDSLQLKEEDNGNPEVFRENVRAAGHAAGASVGAATQQDSSGQTAKGFAQTGQEIVDYLKKTP